jgi:hexosaminidase
VTNQHDRDRILGSEAAMWTELTDTYSLDNKIWPRASALGERLWSRKEVRDIYSARLRLSQHADRLAKRGINPTGITETFCMYHPEICYSP